MLQLTRSSSRTSQMKLAVKSIGSHSASGGGRPKPILHQERVERDMAKGRLDHGEVGGYSIAARIRRAQTETDNNAPNSKLHHAMLKVKDSWEDVLASAQAHLCCEALWQDCRVSACMVVRRLETLLSGTQRSEGQAAEHKPEVTGLNSEARQHLEKMLRHFAKKPPAKWLKTTLQKAEAQKARAVYSQSWYLTPRKIVATQGTTSGTRSSQEDLDQKNP